MRTRVFGTRGAIYKHEGTYQKKTTARTKAKGLRTKGKLARVTKEKKGHAVWWHGVRR